MAECPQSHFSSHHSHHWPQSLSVTLSPKLKLSHLSHGLVLSHSGSLVSGLAHSLSRTQGRRCALYRRLAFKLVVVLCVVSRRRQKQTESTSDPSAGGRCHLLASARLVSFLHSQLVPGQASAFSLKFEESDQQRRKNWFVVVLRLICSSLRPLLSCSCI
ncbi:hypothetical protein S83_007249 [Arachis hypogaea]